MERGVLPVPLTLNDLSFCSCDRSPACHSIALQSPQSTLTRDVDEIQIEHQGAQLIELRHALDVGGVEGVEGVGVDAGEGEVSDVEEAQEGAQITQERPRGMDFEPGQCRTANPKKRPQSN